MRASNVLITRTNRINFSSKADPALHYRVGYLAEQ
jgi:hypothetical protein